MASGRGHQNPRMCTGRTSRRATLTDVVDGTGAELPVELFGPQASEVLDGEGPEVQHVVPGEGISLLQQHHLGPEQSQFDGCAQAAWSSTNDQTLRAGKIWKFYASV